MRDWLQSNPWFYALLVCVILLTIAMICCCYCKTCGPWLARRNRRGYRMLNSTAVQYNQIEEDVSLRQKWLNDSKNQKNCDQDSKDAMELMVHFYLRSDSLYYVQTRFVKSLGHRPDIQWFQLESLCRDGRQVLLKVLPQGNRTPPPGGWNLRTAKTLADVLCNIQHPYVQPLLQMDFIVNHNCVVLLEPLCAKGSLKDVVYKSKPLCPHTEKYASQCGFALTLNVVRSVTLQLIRALQYLTDVLEFPPGQFGCLHAGNAMLAADDYSTSYSNSSESSWSRKHERAPRVLLSGWQSPMLGLPPYVKRVLSRRLLNRYPAALDTLCVGHLVFELACGRSLKKGKPQAQDILDLPEKSRLPVMELLNKIFCEDGPPPSLGELVELPFFQNVQLPHLQKWQPSNLNITVKQRSLLHRIGFQMNGADGSQQSRRSKKDEADTKISVEHTDENIFIGKKISSKRNSTCQDYVQSAPTIITSNLSAPPSVVSHSENAFLNIPNASSATPPPPPPPPPLSTSVLTLPSLSNTGRDALLKDICNGKTLRTVRR